VDVEALDDLLARPSAQVPRSIKSMLTDLKKQLTKNKEVQVAYMPLNPHGYGWLTPERDGAPATLPSRTLLEAVCGCGVFKVTMRDPEAAALLHLAKYHGWPHAALEAFCGDRAVFVNDVLDQCDGKSLCSAEQAGATILKLLHSEGVPLLYRDPRALERLQCGASQHEVPSACVLLASLREEVRNMATGIQERYPAIAASAAAQLCAKGQPSMTALGLAASHIANQMALALAGAVEKSTCNFVLGAMHYDTTYFQNLVGGYNRQQLPAGMLADCKAAVERATGIEVELSGGLVMTTPDAYCEEAEDRLPPVFEGLGLQAKEGKGRQPDRPLANLLEFVVGRQLRDVLRFPGGSGNTFYAYRPGNGCWEKVDATGAASVLQSMYLEWCLTEQRATIPDAFLNTITHDYLLNKMGACTVLDFMKEWSI
jgi:hypothetical protein